MHIADAMSDRDRLYEDIMANHNEVVRPVRNPNDTVNVFIKLRLSQIISVIEKMQIVTTNVWVLQEWHDYSLTWNTEDYNGIKHMRVPASLIWLPDIVLYNNADGKYQITTFTKATIYHSGKVVWEPPAIYKSYCAMNVEWFPYDEQECHMKFGFWSYDGNQADLIHWRDDQVNITKDLTGHTIWVVERAFDFTEYYPSVEWEIIAAPATRHAVRYPCCEAPFIDVTYTLYIRRKTLFYTVNLVIPCLGISYLTILVFYLPADSQQKISLCISILLVLTVFFLLFVEMMPSTSLVIPLIGKYLVFTLVLVSGSVAITIATMNVHYLCHTGNHAPRMPQWVRVWLLDRIPKCLLMKQFKVYEWCPRGMTDMLLKVANDLQYSMEMYAKAVHHKASVVHFYGYYKDAEGLNNHPKRKACVIQRNGEAIWGGVKQSKKKARPVRINDQLKQKLENVSTNLIFIAEGIRRENKQTEMAEEWKYVAMVVDKLFLYVYIMACIIATSYIVLRAPSLRDTREAIM